MSVRSGDRVLVGGDEGGWEGWGGTELMLRTVCILNNKT